MLRALVITDSRVWNAETEYAVAVAEAEAAMGAAVVAAPEGSPARPHAGSPAEFFELPGSSPSSSPADFTANVRALSHLVAGGFDVVHSSRPTAHVMAALAAGSRAPLVHLRGSATPPSRGVGNRLLYGHATDAVVVSSSRVERWVVERLGVEPGRVHRLLAPVAGSWFTDPVAPGAPSGESRALAHELGIPPDSRIVLNVARLAPVKGHDVLLDAMALVVERAPDAVLVLVGEAWSGQPEGLRTRARELGIERSVVFAGRREDVARFVAASSVCVTSSIGSEENSRAVSEYMAGGRPVVGTAVGVIPELVAEGRTGFVVPPGEPAPMAEALTKLVADPALSERMGAEGRQEALDRFSPDAFARGLRVVLDSVGAVK